MVGGRGEEKSGKKVVVIDTNVLISAMLKESGYTRRLLLLLVEFYPVYIPGYALEEIRRHIHRLAERRGIPLEKLRALIALLTEDIRVVDAEEYTPYLSEAKTLVRDPGDTDFAAASLMLRQEYDEVVLLTWNTRDYDGRGLRRRGIRVLTPREAARELIPCQI